MSEFRPRLPLCVVAALALIATVGVHAGFAPGRSCVPRMLGSCSRPTSLARWPR